MKMDTKKKSSYAVKEVVMQSPKKSTMKKKVTVKKKPMSSGY